MIKRMNREKQTNLIYIVALYAAIFGQIGILIAHPLKIEFLITLCTYLIGFTSIVAYFFWMLEKEEVVDQLLFLGLMISCLLSIIASGYITYTSIVKILTFLQLPIYCTIVGKIKNNKKIKGLIYILHIIYTFFFLYLYNSDNAYKIQSGDKYIIIDALTLGYNNPNELALYLFLVFSVLLSGCFYYKRPIIKMFFLLCSIIIFYLIIQTMSRAALFLASILVAMTIFTKCLKLPKRLLKVLFIIPLLFAIILMAFSDKINLIQFFGETFDSGRDTIYKNFFGKLSFLGFIFGDFQKYQFVNMHNAYISIMATIGFLGAFIFVVLLYRQYERMFERKITKKHVLTMAFSLLLIIVYISIEAALFVAGSLYSVSMFLSVYLMKDEE